MNPNFETVTELCKSQCSEQRAKLLLDFLAQIAEPFQSAPASSSKIKHDAEAGGLISHILQVHEHLCTLAKPYQALPVGKTLQTEALWTVALLHDIRKACDASLLPYYIENVLKSGKVSQDKPFKTNEAYLQIEDSLVLDKTQDILLRQAAAILQGIRQIPDGLCSLSLLRVLAPELHLNLTDPERQAILWHDGGYGDAKYSSAGREGILSILTHAADMLASRWNRITAETQSLPEETP